MILIVCNVFVIKELYAIIKKMKIYSAGTNFFVDFFLLL